MSKEARDATAYTFQHLSDVCLSCYTEMERSGDFTFCQNELMGLGVPKLLPRAIKLGNHSGGQPRRYRIDGMDGVFARPPHRRRHRTTDPMDGAVVAYELHDQTKKIAKVFVPAVDKSRKKKAVEPKQIRGAFASAFAEAQSRPLGPAIVLHAEEHDSCVICGRIRGERIRGLCSSCWLSAKRRVGSYQTTWGELEDYGLAVAPQSKPKSQSRT